VKLEFKKIKIYYLLIMIVYGIDCLLVTPIAIYFFNAVEVGLVHAYLFSIFGLASFYLFYFLFFAPAMFLFLNLIKKSRLVLITFTITFCTLMFLVIIHNIQVIYILR